MNSEVYKAVIANNNGMLTQVSELMREYDSADGRAAIGQCLSIIINNTDNAAAQDLEQSLAERLSTIGGSDEKPTITPSR